MSEISGSQGNSNDTPSSWDTGNRTEDPILRKVAELSSPGLSGVNLVKLIRGRAGSMVDLAAEVSDGSSNMKIGNGFDPDLGMLHTSDGDFFFSDQQGLIMKPVSQDFHGIGEQGIGGCQVWPMDSGSLAPQLGKITFGVPPITLSDGKGGAYDMAPSQVLVFDYSRSADEDPNRQQLGHGYNVYDEVMGKMLAYNEQRSPAKPAGE